MNLIAARACIDSPAIFCKRTKRPGHYRQLSVSSGHVFKTGKCADLDHYIKVFSLPVAVFGRWAGCSKCYAFLKSPKGRHTNGTTSPQNNDDIGQTRSYCHYYIMGNGDRPDPQNLRQPCFRLGISSKTVWCDDIAWRGGFFEPACDATSQSRQPDSDASDAGNRANIAGVAIHLGCTCGRCVLHLQLLLFAADPTTRTIFCVEIFVQTGQASTRGW